MFSSWYFPKQGLTVNGQLSTVHRNKVQHPQRTGRHAGGRQTRIQVVAAKVALAHVTGFGVVLRRGVGTGPGAISTSDAFGGVQIDNAILTDGIRVHGADARALWMDTVITSHGQVISEDCVFPHAVGAGSPSPVFRGLGAREPRPYVGPFATADLVHPSPQYTCRKVVLVFAGGLAGFATGAGGSIEDEGVGHEKPRRRLKVEGRRADF